MSTTPHNWQPHDLLTPGESARLLRVHPKTIARYCDVGTLPSIKTPGGHRRIYYAAIRAQLVGLDPWGSCETLGLPLPPRPTNPTP